MLHAWAQWRRYATIPKCQWPKWNRSRNPGTRNSIKLHLSCGNALKDSELIPTTNMISGSLVGIFDFARCRNLVHLTIVVLRIQLIETMGKIRALSLQKRELNQHVNINRTKETEGF